MAARSQALDHEDPDTYRKYQSQPKRMHIQAAYCGLKSDFEWRDMEDSMTHHRDPNVPQDLNARAISDFEEDE